ncbi:hypothetical protein [Kocuria sp. LHG3120]|uniref:hypothetical protein n=1 Tax=Kocuria sp. LHG3120 TaxID=2804590 RepID=UPI003CF85AFE
MPKENASLSRSRVILGALEESMLSDLDPRVGGFSWWQDFNLTDDQRRYLSDYLCELTFTLQDVLGDMASILSMYEQKRATRDFQMKMRFNDPSGKGPYIPAGKTEYEAGQLASILRDQYFFKLGSLLDLLSALLIGVTGVESNIRRAEYKLFRTRQELEALSNKGTRRFSFSPNEAEKSAQKVVALSMAAAIEAIEPAGWLDWCIDFRNTIIHRSPGVNYTNTINNRVGMVTKIIETPALVPSKSFLESVFQKDNMNEVLIAEDIGEIMNGSFEALCAVVAGTLEAASNLWEKRRAAEVVIRQPATQWPVGSSPDIGFNGYSPSPVVFKNKDTVAVHPNTGRRLRGAGPNPPSR